MGCVSTVSFDKFPEQSKWRGKQVNVYFHYDTSKEVKGTIVRDDREDPYRTIISLEDGRYVLGIECQFTVIRRD